MAASNEKISAPRSLTPLWVISCHLYRSQTATLGVAATQTAGAIQITLTIFVVLCPRSDRCRVFRGALWKPYAFYPPSEYGTTCGCGPVHSSNERGFSSDREGNEGLCRLKTWKPLVTQIASTLLFKAKGPTWISEHKGDGSTGRLRPFNWSTKSLHVRWLMESRRSLATYVPGDCYPKRDCY